MSPFQRGKFWHLYVPRQSGGVVQRATGTTNATLAKQMQRMIEALGPTGLRRWDVLSLVADGSLSLGALWDAYAMNALDALVAAQRAEAVPTIVSHVDAWVATLRQAPRTIVHYQQKVRALLAGHETLRPAGLTSGWVSDRLAQLPHQPAVVRQYASALRLFCQYLVRHRVLIENPVRDVPLPRGTGRRAVWHPAEVDRRLCDAAPEPLRSYFALVHATGADRDSALVMRRRDLDLTPDADGRCWADVPGTKTRTRARRVPIDAWAWDILASHCRGLLPDAPLFPGLTRNAVNHDHRTARRAIGMPNYQLRDARHSVGVRWFLAGVPLWQVSRWLGHSSVAITARVYLQFGVTDVERHMGRATSHATSTRSA